MDATHARRFCTIRYNMLGLCKRRGMEMARVREFNEDQVLDAAMHLFWSKGYPGTSIQDLVDATGLKPPSIYNAYGNKRGLFNVVLARYSEQVMAGFVKAVQEAPTARAAVERLLKAIVKQNFDAATPGGCLVGLAAQERNLHDSDTQAAVGKEFRKLDDAVCARLTKGKSDGEFADNLDPRGTSTAIVSICAGLLTLGRGNYTKHALQRAIRAVRQFLPSTS